MSRFLSKKLSSLEAYTPGEQPRDKKYIKLNTNEFPYPPAPDVISAVNADEMRALRLYPDPTGAELKARLAEFYGVGSENVFISNGSDDILNFSFMAFCDGGAAYADITYGFYPVFAELYGINSKIIPLKDDLSLDVDEFCRTDSTCVIANPNAPTGLAISLADVERIVSANENRVVVVDEAYVDFGGESAVALTKKYKNLLVCQTYSKSRGMAGARLGFAIGDAALIADLELIKYSTNPYNLDRLTLAAGVAALTDDSRRYYAEKQAELMATRDSATAALTALGAEVIPSLANFIFVKIPSVSGAELNAELRRRGILVRHFKTERIKDYNRISIGTPEEMATLVCEIEKIIGERK